MGQSGCSLLPHPCCSTARQEHSVRHRCVNGGPVQNPHSLVCRTSVLGTTLKIRHLIADFLGELCRLFP